MTIKKAIEILDYVIEKKLEKKNGLLDPLKQWNQGVGSIKEMSNIVAGIIDDDIKILQAIRKEIVPKCKHPKKMRNKDANGNWYCMNCNLDLDNNNP